MGRAAAGSGGRAGAVAAARRAAVVAAEGRLYLFNTTGGGTVAAQGDTFRILATNRLDSGCYASPAVVGLDPGTQCRFGTVEPGLHRPDRDSGPVLDDGGDSLLVNCGEDERLLTLQVVKFGLQALQFGQQRVGILAYGSSHPAIVESRVQLQKERGIETDYLRVRGYPFAREVHAFVERHDRVYVVEQNRDAQLAALLQLDLAPELAPRLRRIAHVHGLPLDARSVTDEIRTLEAR